MRFLRFLDYKKILVWVFYGFLIFIPWGMKKFIAAFGQPINEFNSVFLYGSDVFLILFLGLFCFLVYFGIFKPVRVDKKTFVLLIFLVLAFGSILFSSHQILAVHHFTRLALMVMLTLAVSHLLKEGILKFSHIAAVIAASSVFQSLVAIFQFKFFRSLNLRLLGESIVNVFTENVARFRIGDLTFLRSFGTMPHANILAAFLVLGLLSFYYLWLRKNTKLHYLYHVVLVIGLFLVSLSLLFTFSRSGWLAATIVTFFTILWGLLNKNFRKQTISLLIILIAICSLLLTNFSWLVLPRAHLSAVDPSVSQRWLYNEIGWNIIKSNPLGVGVGNQLLYAIDSGFYQRVGLSRRIDWQPVHNIYLLIAAEIGIIGALAFLLFIAIVIFEKLKNRKLIENSTAIMMLVSLLLFGLVDHFPWTLQSGRLMLWLTISLVLGLSLRNNKLKSS